MKAIRTLFLQTILLAASCTHNPFFNEQDIADQTRVEGRVRLINETEHDQIVVWFEPFDMLTRTGSNGEFSLQFPPPVRQMGKGLNGAYPIYFYMADYDLDSTVIHFQNGSVLWGEGPVDDSGRLTQDITLSKRINLSIGFDRPHVYRKQTGAFRGAIKMSATCRTVVKVTKMWKSATTAVLMESVVENPEFPEIITHPQFRGESSERFTLNSQTQICSILISWPPISGRYFKEWEPGYYRIYPFLFVEDAEMPEHLRDQLSQLMTPDTGYLGYPMKHNFGRLEIK